MLDPGSLNTPLAGFAAGLVTSLHCVGMCGPLACALLPARRGDTALSAQASFALYHGSRLISYTLIGAVAGAIGSAVAFLFTAQVTRLLPWALVALFILFLLGWEKKLPAIPWVSGFVFRLKLKAGGMNRKTLATLLGLFTPFLPCAPLYLVFGVALFTGSAVAGGLLLAAFAAGTMAPLWLLQSGWAKLQTRFSPLTLRRAQQGMALIAIVLVAWRALAVGDVSPGEMPTPACCPTSE